MASERCPCGSGDTYDGCCGPALRGAPAPTPEALMRSRYTAFARRDADYIAATWHPGTRPEDTAPDAEIRWTGLEVLDAPPPSATRGVVEFRAHYRSGGVNGVVHERSRFVFQSGRWWYLDGATPGTDR